MEKGRETERLMPFGQCLRQILKEKRISASALSRMMENKSRNSLFRILEGSTSPATQEAFFHRLVRGNWLSLTKAQQQMLRESLEVSRLGVEGYRSNQAMRKMLRDVDEQRARRPIDLESADRGACGTFDRQLEQYARCRAVSMTLIGCCDREICAAIADGLLHGRGGCRVKITHYLYTGGDAIIRAVAAIQPLLYAPCYEAYCVEPCMFSAEREQTYRANSLIVRWEDHSGQTHLHMFLLVDRNRLLMMDRCGEQAISLMERMWRADRAQMHPLKSAFALRHSPEDYLAYTEAFCELERGRAIYTVKMDMCLAFISTKTLVAPVVDGFTETGFAGQEGLAGLSHRFISGGLRTCLPKRSLPTPFFPSGRWKRLRAPGNSRIISLRCGPIPRRRGWTCFAISRSIRLKTPLLKCTFSKTALIRRRPRSACMRGAAR